MKLTQEQLNQVIKSATEKVLAEKGLNETIRKINFNDKPVAEMAKEEKTVSFFKALFAGDKAKANVISGATSDEGQTLLPTEFINDIIDLVVKQPYALRRYVHVENVNFRTGSVPTVEGGVVMAWRENDTRTSNVQTPKFGSIAYAVHALDGYTAISKETMFDTPVNIYNKLLTLYADAFTKAENDAILVGSGSSQPTGVRTNDKVPSVTIADTTNGLITAKDILGVEFNIPATYRAGAMWVMNTKALAQIRQLLDENGRPLFVKGDITQGKPDTLAGYPVLEMLDGTIPENLTEGSVTNCTEIIFGNFSGYYLFDRREFTTEVNTQSDTSFFSNQIIVKCSNRYDGNVAIPKAFVRVKGIKVGA